MTASKSHQSQKDSSVQGGLIADDRALQGLPHCQGETVKTMIYKERRELSVARVPMTSTGPSAQAMHAKETVKQDSSYLYRFK